MAKKTLILLRHAKSDWYSDARGDSDRPLNHRGRKDAPNVGKWFGKNRICPDRIVCSSAERTRETLELVLREAQWSDADVQYDSDLYLASENQILNIAKDNLTDVDSVMLVGHNPGMDYTLMGLCPNVSANLDGKLMTTAAFAIIDCDDQNLENPTLVEFHRAKDL